MSHKVNGLLFHFVTRIARLFFLFQQRRHYNGRILGFLPRLVIAKYKIENSLEQQLDFVDERCQVEEEHGAHQNHRGPDKGGKNIKHYQYGIAVDTSVLLSQMVTSYSQSILMEEEKVVVQRSQNLC